MVGMIFQSGIIYFIYSRMLLQKFSYFLCAATVLLYTQVQGFNSADHQPAIEGGQNGATGVLIELQFITQLFFFGNYQARYKIAMAAEVLGSRMHYNISSQ